jgi:membrane protein implicated in regulation of membrane protease activity
MQVLKEEIVLTVGFFAWWVRAPKFVPTIDLFAWWAISISWSIAFLIVAGFYLYGSSRAKRKEDTWEESKRAMNDEHSVKARTYKTQWKATARSLAKDFIFVWTLLGLLIFYIFSVQLGTGTLPEVVFVAGNIVVEVLLVFYLLRNRDKIPTEEQTETPGQELHAEARAPTEN